MFLALVFQILDSKNDDGQGRNRRHHPDKDEKGRRRMTRLSVRKHTILEETAIAFSQAYHRVIEWGYANWDAVPFTFPATTKDGKPVLDKEGKQKLIAMPAHGLANWLSSHVKLADLGMSSKIGNGVLNQAAETLLSQYKLRETAEKDPKRLTGPKVGRVTRPPITPGEVGNSFDAALATIKRVDATDEELETASSVIQKLCPDPHWLPVLFARPNDFLLFRHTKTDQIFVALPLLGRGNDRAVRSSQNGKPDLVPLRIPIEGENLSLPNSKQWIIFPLCATGSDSRSAVRYLTDPAVRVRTGELLKVKNDWHFNIIVDVPEEEQIAPEKFMGIHIGDYRIYWLISDGTSGIFDLSHLRKTIEEAARQRRYAFDRNRPDLLMNYRGVLKLERERVVNALVALAVKHKCAIGVEDISGVEKSTWSKKYNLFRSHWDFGAFAEVLRYKAVIAGLPTIGRSQSLFTVSGGVAWSACSICGANNTGKQNGGKLVAVDNGTVRCASCQNETQFDANAVVLIAQRTEEYWKKKKR